MGRFGWTTVLVLIVVVLAWWGLRMIWWRMNYIVPAFGIGMLTGAVLTAWIFTTTRRRRLPRHE